MNNKPLGNSKKMKCELNKNFRKKILPSNSFCESGLTFSGITVWQTDNNVKNSLITLAVGPLFAFTSSLSSLNRKWIYK